MEITPIVMWLGFALASYSVVGNDVIQTLGTFLTSNERRVRWWVLWLYAGIVLSYVLINGYMMADIDYGRLDKFTFPEVYQWYYLLPPLVLLTITRWGIPVSTTFMILTLFSLTDIPNDLGAMVGSVFDSGTKLGGMIQKSLMGYLIAFSSAIVLYLGITRLTEKYFIENPISKRGNIFWTIAQWFTTAFLWFQWLTQDLANIYIYLKGGAELSVFQFAISLIILLVLLGYIFYSRGGSVQKVVREKTNTADIRSATFVDLIYGVVLYIFKYDYFGLWGGKLPMSTTWVFIGLLAGRELAIRLSLEKKISKKVGGMVARDLAKVFFGLVVSVVLVFIIKLMAG
ncbi:MAG: hypothetical protein GYB31_01380 [Bacteroidetes bacterium]|nr:hypothetical protein [Bacteroidota bacterium]